MRSRLKLFARKLAARFDRHHGLWLLVSAALLVAGWLLPVMTVEQLFILSDQVSILSAIILLYEEGEYGLFGIVFLFTVIFPVAKLALAFLLWRRLRKPSPRLARLVGRVEAVGRWSMLDVFVVALFVVVVRLSSLSDVTIHAGLYVFAAAVTLSIIVVRRVAVLARRRAGSAPETGAVSA